MVSFLYKQQYEKHCITLPFSQFIIYARLSLCDKIFCSTIFNACFTSSGHELIQAIMLSIIRVIGQRGVAEDFHELLPSACGRSKHWAHGSISVHLDWLCSGSLDWWAQGFSMLLSTLCAERDKTNERKFPGHDYLEALPLIQKWELHGKNRT